MTDLARRGLRSPAAVITGGITLLAVDLVATHSNAEIPAGLLLAILLAFVAAWIARHWSWLVMAVGLVALLIPNEGTYAITGGPVKLEPYRLLVGLILIGFLIALLVDPRVRLRRTKFEGPLALIVLAVVGSEVLNPGRVSATSNHMVKAIWLFATFVLFLYMVVSTVRTREVVERLLTVLVCAGCVVAVGAEVQRRTGFNLFYHLHPLLPIFHFNTPNAALDRGGAVRATASAGHPIELSDTMAMLVPIAAYLAISRRQRIWWGAALLLVLGDFVGGSKTGIVGLLACLGVFLWLRPRSVLRAWPALLPILVVVHFAAPSAIGGMLEAFFPKEGFIAAQSHTFIGRGGKTEDATRLSRVGPILHGEFAEHNPFFGEGYGTRITGEPIEKENNAIVLDDQWLGTLVEIGILGVTGWVLLLGLVIRRLGKRAKLERGTREGWLPVALAGSVAAFAASIATYDAFSFVQAVLLVYLIIACASVILWLPPTRTPDARII
jgi:polysaccharide biosynthesis protein PslJ